MPTDNPTLADLAASAERDAAAGVKPREWWTITRNVFNQPCAMAFGGVCFVITDGRYSFDAPWSADAVATRLSSLLAAQLFAESLLRRATSALHPPEPHVAAAVRATAKAVSLACDLDLDFVESWRLLDRELVDCGLVTGGGRNPKPTALGRALLNCGPPVEPATRDAKESADARRE